MVDDADQNAEPEWLKRLPVRSEEIGFGPDDLVACVKCGKANAPNRATCLYCGAARPGMTAEERFEIRELEDWENGFNVVLLDARGADIRKAVNAVGKIIPADLDFLKTVFESGKNIPIVRAASNRQAQLVTEKLGELGIVTTIVEDAALKSTTPPVRLRSIRFGATQLEFRLFNVDEVHTLDTDKLVLVVVGMIFEGRNESVERKKMRGTKVLDESAISSDEPVVDIYSDDDPIGWRVPASGFDFSSLGRDKSLVAAENMTKLIAKLVESGPRARLVDDYASVRPLVEVNWPAEVKRERNSFGFGRKDISTVSTTRNVIQFTRYSRMHWRLLHEEKV